MRCFNTLFLLFATTSVRLVSAVDVCPGTYCSPGVHCGHDPNGPHCCSADNMQDVVSDLHKLSR
ncbi:hypothetical protein GGS20DRAFT_483858 [Poronia punctata]|nr:hypothetical protein GGS20DRAFT_483858 [Poronia punctata]